MDATLTFEIKFRSDYHISTGSGKGSEVDSALLRDSDGMPVIRGATISGLLRDGLWRLLQLEPLKKYQTCKSSGLDADQTGYSYCGQFDDTSGECPLCRIFGTPKSPKRWHIGSARPTGIEMPVNRKEPLKMDAQIVYRVRVNPRTRRTEPYKLFSQENGDARLTFRFDITGSGDDEQLLDEVALLVAAARNVRELGRSRRRGQGECRIHLVAADSLPDCVPDEKETLEAKLLDRFQERWLSGKVPTTPSVSRAAPGEPDSSVLLKSSSTTSAKRFRLIIRLDEPLILTRRSEARNQFETLDAISGTSVWGAFAALAATRKGLSNPASYADFINVFRRDQARFSWLYPLKASEGSGRNMYPAIPAPLDFLTCKIFPGLKKENHGAHTFALLSDRYCPQCQNEKGKDYTTPLKTLSGFITMARDPQELEPARRHEMHIRIQPETQRVEPGLLYDYVALEAGQYFAGEIIFANDAIWQTWQKITGITAIKQPFSLRLGKATRRGYGKVTGYLEPCDAHPPLWIGTLFDKRVPDSQHPKRLILTLLTDAILLDAWGRFQVSFDEQWLRELLNVPLKNFTVFTQQRAIDGFDGTLGLPRQRDIAIRAGSTVEIELSTPFTDEQLSHLKTLEEQGIGMRRSEGFGQIVFNHPILFHQPSYQSAPVVLHDKLRLASLTASNYDMLKIQDFLLNEWEERTLNQEKHWENCQSAEFGVVARWLSENCQRTLSELRQQLREYGKPDERLITEFIRDYGSRSQELKVCQEGIDVIDNMLEKLEKVAENLTDNCRVLAVNMLAERIAEEAERQQAEKQF